MTTLLGDINAHKEKEILIAGQYTIRKQRNDNGQLLYNAMVRNMLIITAKFQHTETGKTDANQIDHILISIVPMVTQRPRPLVDSEALHIQMYPITADVMALTGGF